jgi:hypothetical protein
MLNQALKLVAILGIAVASYSSYHYYMIYLPQVETARRMDAASAKENAAREAAENAAKEAADKATALQSCFNEADQNYIAVQDSLCLQTGRQAGCQEFIGSPKDIEFSKILDDQKRICVDTYK